MTDDVVLVLLSLVSAITCGAAGDAIGRSKGRRAGGLLGVLLGVFGVAFMAVLRRRPDAPPATGRWYARPELLLSLLAFALTFGTAAYAGRM